MRPPGGVRTTPTPSPLVPPRGPRSSRGEVVESLDEITWWPFAGDAANLLLARLLEAALGASVVSRNTSITLKGDAGRSLAAVHEVVRELVGRKGPTVEDAARHAQGAGARGRMSKFDPCLPPALFARLVVEGVLDVAGARAVVAATQPTASHRSLAEGSEA